MALEGGDGSARKGAKALGESVGGRGANGAGATDDHVADGGGGGAEVGSGDDGEAVREEALFDEENGVAFWVERDGAEVATPAAEVDVHGATTERGVEGRTCRIAGATREAHVSRRRLRSGRVAGSPSRVESRRPACDRKA